MGIHERDYYREDNNGRWHRNEVSGTIFLVALHIVLFFIAANDEGNALLVKNVGFDVAKIQQGEIWRLLTSQLIPMRHLMILAIGLSLLFWSGSAVESIYGRKWFVTFYLFAGVIGSLAKLAVALSMPEMKYDPFGMAPSLFAVMVLHACHFPRSPTIFNIPVVVFVGSMFGIYVVAGFLKLVTLNIVGDATSVFASAAFTWFFFSYFDRMRDALSRSPTAHARRQRLRMYNPNEELDEPVSNGGSRQLAHSTAATMPVVDEQLEAKLDQVLEKVAKSGRDALTPAEQDILMRASEVYKKRREH